MQRLLWFFLLVTLTAYAEDIVKPLHSYKGWIQTAEDQPRSQAVLIRSPQEWGEFQKRLSGQRPCHDRKALEPNPDPLRKGLKIDFSKQMAVAVWGRDIHTDVRVRRVERTPNGVKVHRIVDRPEGSESLPAPRGIGRYELWVVPRMDGPLMRLD